MKIGWIGAGIMGQPMVCHLLNQGNEVHVYARHPEKVKNAIETGAILEKDIQSLVASSDVICTMVGFPSDVKEVYETIESCIEPGKICIDFTTSSPTLAQELYRTFSQKNVQVLDAPVTGGDVGAQKGTLTVLVGGEESTFEQVKPLFEAFGSQIEYCGLAGSGQHVKMANQIMIANTLQGICEALIYLQEKKVDPQYVVSYLGQGAAGSRQLDLNGQKMLDQDYEPGFMVKHFVKDLRIATDECSKNLEGIQKVIEEYVDLMDKGYSDKGTQCLIEFFKEG